MKKTVFALALIMALALPQLLQAQADGPGTGTRWANPGGAGVSALELKGIVFGNGKYVIVGGANQGQRNGNILYSTDGLNWTVVANPPASRQFTGVVFGNNVFIAVGLEGKIVRSTDGIKWTEVANPFGNTSINDVAFGNNMFVAVGAQGKIAYAAANNSTKWTAVANSPFGTSEIQTVTNHGSTFYAGGKDGKMAYSDKDIKKWNVVNSPVNSAIMGIKSGPQGSGLWVAVGNFGIITATNGTNWKQVVDVNAFVDGFGSVTYGNGRFIAGGSMQGVIVYSTDGIKWAASKDVDRYMSLTDGSLTGSFSEGFKGSDTHYNSIIWADGRFTAVGHPAIIIHSY